MYTFCVFLFSFVITFLIIKFTVPRFKKRELIGLDMNKPGKPEVPEMGGISMVFGVCGGILLVIGLQTFLNIFQSVEPVPLLIALLTIFVMAQIGILDDLIGVRQVVKAAVPIFASIPLVMIKAGDTRMSIPFLKIGIDFGLFYPLVLVPFGITGAANAVNMLAGFNGLEVGMGIIACGSLAFIAYSLEAATSLLILAPALGALIATLYFNWFPAKVLIGDVGTFSIGAIIASAVIIGNFEVAGAIIIIPYLIDFCIKAVNDFPSGNWWGSYQNGKLCCLEERPLGLAHLIMKVTNGITEKNLVLILIGFEAVFGLLAVLFYTVL